jgi:hypothetical protein
MLTDHYDRIRKGSKEIYTLDNLYRLSSVYDVGLNAILTGQLCLIALGNMDTRKVTF